jgi:hypothetical protein
MNIIIIIFEIDEQWNIIVACILAWFGVWLPGWHWHQSCCPMLYLEITSRTARKKATAVQDSCIVALAS